MKRAPWKAPHPLFAACLNAALLLALIVYVYALVAATSAQHTPIPFWDTWSHTRFDTWDWQRLVSQHNEHRIVFTRMALYLDHILFKGRLALPLAFHVALMAATALCFFLLLRNGFQEKNAAPAREAMWWWTMPLLFCASVPAMSLMQHGNIFWEFQSQMFMTVLFPVASLALLQMSLAQKHDGNQSASTVYFVLAALVAAMSALTMGNGILFYPVFFAATWAGGFERRKLFWLGGFLALALMLYFSGYDVTTASNKSPDAPRGFILAALQFLVAILGAPFYFLFHKSAIFWFFGAVVLLTSAGNLLHLLRSLLRKNTGSQVQLLAGAGLVYFLGTILAVSFGRASFGYSHALASKYTTVSLAALAMNCIYLAAAMPPQYGRRFIAALSAFLLLTFVPLQLSLKETLPEPFMRQLAGLAIAFDINDYEVTSKTFPYVPDMKNYLEQEIGIDKEPVQDPAAGPQAAPFGYHFKETVLLPPDKSFLTLPPYSYAQQEHKQWRLPPEARPLTGAVDVAMDFPFSRRFSRVMGWGFEEQQHAVPEYIIFTDQTGTVVGFAFPGLPRPDLVDFIHPNARRAGFLGYILKAYSDDLQNIRLYGLD